MPLPRDSGRRTAPPRFHHRRHALSPRNAGGAPSFILSMDSPRRRAGSGQVP
ncbi:hypothetical protein BTZ20_5820 [Rhodococcus sp. MTM3W5.2]|nr:hypothetical protein BTZ20_5820 [Rhodococcus sp. MTM3W5.2]